MLAYPSGLTYHSKRSEDRPTAQRAGSIVSLIAYQFSHSVFTGPVSLHDKYQNNMSYVRPTLPTPQLTQETVSPSPSSNPLWAPPPPVASHSTQPFSASSARNSTIYQAKYNRRKNQPQTGMCISSCDHTTSHPLQVVCRHLDLPAATSSTRSTVVPAHQPPGRRFSRCGHGLPILRDQISHSQNPTFLLSLMKSAVLHILQHGARLYRHAPTAPICFPLPPRPCQTSSGETPLSVVSSPKCPMHKLA